MISLIQINIRIKSLIYIFIGIDNNNKSFFISFAFLPDQTRESYKWALFQNKELYCQLNTLTIIVGPRAISTDCDQAFRNAITQVFPESSALLCAWHANKDVQQHCRPKFSTTEAWEGFFWAWQSILHANSEDEYEDRLLQFS